MENMENKRIVIMATPIGDMIMFQDIETEYVSTKAEGGYRPLESVEHIIASIDNPKFNDVIEDGMYVAAFMPYDMKRVRYIVDGKIYFDNGFNIRPLDVDLSGYHYLRRIGDIPEEFEGMFN